MNSGSLICANNSANRISVPIVMVGPDPTMTEFVVVSPYSAKKAKRMTKRMATMAVAGWICFHLPVKSFSTT